MEDGVKGVAGIAFDATARVMALEVLITRMLAASAQLDPLGIAERMINNTDEMVATVEENLPPEMAKMAPLIEPYLRHYLERAARLRDEAS